jgi:hypothetical protein
MLRRTPANINMLKHSIVRICAYGIPKISNNPAVYAFATTAINDFIEDVGAGQKLKGNADVNSIKTLAHFKMNVDKIWYPFLEKPSCRYFDPKSVRIFLQNEFTISKTSLLIQRKRKLVDSKGNNNPLMSWKTAKRLTNQISEGIDFYHKIQAEKKSVEHVLPQSFVKYIPELTRDLIMLRTINFNFNCKRQNMPYGDMDTQETIMRKGVCYVRNDIKGELSRIMLYAFIMYEQTLSKINFDYNIVGKLEMFIAWCLENLPTESEISINGKIEKYQGNRNPLVDDIELCKAAYGLNKN